MKACPYCAEEIQEKAVKCKHCGEWLESTDVDSSSQSEPSEVDISLKLVPCELCNRTISATAVFCPQCGKSLSNTSRVGALIKKSAKNSTATAAVYGLGVLLGPAFVVAFAAGFAGDVVRNRATKKLARKHRAIDIIQQWGNELHPSILVTEAEFIFLDSSSDIFLQCHRSEILGATIDKAASKSRGVFGEKTIVMFDHIHGETEEKITTKLEFLRKGSYERAEFALAKIEEYIIKEQ